jgi:D-inositol-3-phosphate glycosyltransferase
MPSSSHRLLDVSNSHSFKQNGICISASEIMATILTGGVDRPYAFGLSTALSSKGVKLDVIGGKELGSPELYGISGLNFIELHKDQRQSIGVFRKLLRVAAFYFRIICYAATAKPKIFHILWNYKFQMFDRTILLLYYKMLGKKIVFTAHNVDATERDGNGSVLNRFSLKAQYRLVDHIFVHTEQMKYSLIDRFGVKTNAISVIPFGINNSVPDTDLTSAEAKQRLGVGGAEKTILFFGRIRPYKGLDYLVAAFRQITSRHKGYRLIIAGEPKKESVKYWQDIQRVIEQDQMGEQVIQDIRFIADEETEVYFKAADVLVLPYRVIFQSGVLFLAYSFGLPVIATDVGSLRDDIVEGVTGYVCRSCDETDLATTIETYFGSNLFKTLDCRRSDIRNFVQTRNSWDVVSDRTCNVYAQLLAQDK